MKSPRSLSRRRLFAGLVLLALLAFARPTGHPFYAAYATGPGAR